MDFDCSAGALDACALTAVPTSTTFLGRMSVNLQDGSADSGADAGISCAKVRVALQPCTPIHKLCRPGVFVPSYFLVRSFVSSLGAVGRFAALGLSWHVA